MVISKLKKFCTQALVVVTCILSCACSPRAGFSSISEKPRELSVLLVVDENLSSEHAQAALNYARENYLASLNIKINTAYTLNLPVTSKDFIKSHGLQAWKQRVKELQKTLPQNQEFDVVYLMVRPEGLGKVEGCSLRGLSEGIGLVPHTPNAFAVSMVTGSSRIDGKVMMHEMAHLLGAQHSESGLMRAKIPMLEFSGGFSQESVAQIIKGASAPQVTSATCKACPFSSALVQTSAIKN